MSYIVSTGLSNISIKQRSFRWILLIKVMLMLCDQYWQYWFQFVVLGGCRHLWFRNIHFLSFSACRSSYSEVFLFNRLTSSKVIAYLSITSLKLYKSLQLGGWIPSFWVQWLKKAILNDLKEEKALLYTKLRRVNNTDDRTFHSWLCAWLRKNSKESHKSVTDITILPRHQCTMHRFCIRNPNQWSRLGWRSDVYTCAKFGLE
jgi:hypothetical protein